jgi:hypothetical protein
MARAAQAQASQAQNTAAQTGGSLLSQGQAIQSNLVPQLTAETTADHSMDPNQINSILTAANAGAGGATAGLEGRAELESAATRQGGPSSAMMDSLARGQQQTAAKASEGVAAQDVKGALQNRQTAFNQLGQMGQADTSDALKAMGLQTGDVNAETTAGSQGWMQNLTGMMAALRGAGAKGVTL